MSSPTSCPEHVQTASIFLSLSILPLIKSTLHLNLDGTFFFVPTLFDQLYTIHLKHHGKVRTYQIILLMKTVLALHLYETKYSSAATPECLVIAYSVQHKRNKNYALFRFLLCCINYAQTFWPRRAPAFHLLKFQCACTSRDYFKICLITIFSFWLMPLFAYVLMKERTRWLYDEVLNRILVVFQL